MRAVVLVGGFGTRLQPLTLTTPKPLLPVGHRPILELAVANLARGGVTEVVLSLGFKPDAFRAAYPHDECAGVGLLYAVEPEPLDTAGAIRFAADFAGIDDTFIVFNGDVLTDLDVARLVTFHRQHGGEGTLHLTPVDDPSAFGVVPTAPDGRVEAFVEKPPRDQAPTNLINAGTYVLEPEVLARIPTDRRVSIERETFPAMVADGALWAMASDDYWLDAGRPELYLQANLDVIDGRRAHLAVEAVASTASLDPAAIVLRSVIGAFASVGPGATVEGSVLLPGAAVGAGATVVDSILGARAVIGDGARVVEAVLGDGVEVEPGASLHGVRVPQPS
jgi:mannose-1-phosphate guanylyltransferase